MSGMVELRTIEPNQELLASVNSAKDEDPTSTRHAVVKLVEEDTRFQGTQWVVAQLTGVSDRTYLLDIQGHQEGHPEPLRRIAVHGLTAGFNGSGPTETARILALLGFGDKEELLRKLAVQQQSYDFSLPSVS